MHGMLKSIPKREANAIADKYMKKLNIHPADPDCPVENLSNSSQ